MCAYNRTELPDVYKDNAEENLINLLNSEHVPASVLQIILNLAEFMEHEDRMLRLSNQLGRIATDVRHSQLSLTLTPLSAIILSYSAEIDLFC